MITLTTTDVKAFRQANRYVVRLNRDGVKITLIKERKRQDTGPFKSDSNDDLRYELNANSPEHNRDKDACFVQTYPGGAFKALTLLMRPGDTLYFSARDNGNNYLRVAEIPVGKLDSAYHPHYNGLHADELTVSIERNGKMILQDLLLTYTVCPDNTARAIKAVTYTLNA